MIYLQPGLLGPFMECVLRGFEKAWNERLPRHWLCPARASERTIACFVFGNFSERGGKRIQTKTNVVCNFKRSTQKLQLAGFQR